MSLARLERLARFDRAWDAALGKLDATKLSAAAQADLETLRATVTTNAASLDDDRRAIAEIAPVVPFAPPLVRLIEARLWIEAMDAEAAAGTLTRATEQVTATRQRLQAGIGDGANGLTTSSDQSEKAAAVVDVLHRDLTEWFNFYNGYDPLFTWWMGLPWQHADQGLRQYSAFLRDTVAFANRPAAPAAMPSAGCRLPSRTRARRTRAASPARRAAARA